MIAVLVIAIWIGAAAVPFWLLERRWQWRWQEVEIGTVPAQPDLGLYRESGSVPAYLRRAPRPILWAAFSCLLFGELALPGLVIATFGMFLFGLGLVLIPILVTAGKLYRAGLLLLRREPRTAYFAARNAAMWSLWCVGLGSLLSMLFVFWPNGFGWPLLAGWTPIALMIAAQALFLLRVTRRYEDALFAESRLVRLGDHWVSTDAA